MCITFFKILNEKKNIHTAHRCLDGVAIHVCGTKPHRMVPLWYAETKHPMKLIEKKLR